MTMTVFAFDESRVHRDREGQFADGIPGLSARADRLKLGGKIPLGEGEALRSTDRVAAHDGGNGLIAAVDTPSGRQVRFGLDEEEGWDNWEAADDGFTANLNPQQAHATAAGLDTAARRAGDQAQEAEVLADWLDEHDTDHPRYEEINERHTALTSGFIQDVQSTATPWGDVVYGFTVDDVGLTRVIAGVRPDDAEPGWDLDDARGRFEALTLTLSQARRLAQKLRDAAGPQSQTAAMVDFAIPDQLADYWLHGKGAAKVRWCTRGSFRRARRLLRKYIPPGQLDGAVANLYHRACGKWPGRRGGENALALDTTDTVMVGPDAPVLVDQRPSAHGTDGAGYNRVDWHGPLAPIDIATGDRREFAPGALSTRQLPLPFRWQEKAADGHAGAVVVGSLTGYDIRDDGTIWGSGYFLDPDVIPDVRKAMHLVEHGVVGPSVDLEPDMDVMPVDEQGEEFDPQQCQVDGECPDKPRARITRATIAGATLVPITAFAEARAPMLTQAGHEQFCLTPLHPGPCKGWRGAPKTPSPRSRSSRSKTTPKTPSAPDKPAAAKPTGAAASGAPQRVTPTSDIGTPSSEGKVTAVKPAAMDKDWKDWNDGLSKAQQGAVHEYTTSGYFQINKALKSKDTKQTRAQKALIKQAETIQSAMAPAPRGAKLYRGTNTTSVGLPAEPTLNDVKALVGKTLVNDAFTSTSVSADEIFAGNLEFEIDMPEGTPSLWLNGNSRLPDEHEVLLAAGSKMRVVSVKESPAGSGNYKVKTRIV